MVSERPDFAQKVGEAGTEAVSKHIEVVQRTDLFSPIDVPADHARSSRVVRIIQNWINRIWWFGPLIACALNRTFTDPPPVVFASTGVKSGSARPPLRGYAPPTSPISISPFRGSKLKKPAGISRRCIYVKGVTEPSRDSDRINAVPVRIERVRLINWIR